MQTPNREGRQVLGSPRRQGIIAFAALAGVFALPTVLGSADPALRTSSELSELDPTKSIVYSRSMMIEGLDIFYREAGSRDNPTIVLLHGFPTSSHMFRNLIPELSRRYHVIAPDYPGYGYSSMPSVEEFDYSFDRLAQIVDGLLDSLGLESYSLYLMDYGAPIGFRIAAEHPERVEALIVQNGNAYDAGLREFWDPIKRYWGDQSEANARPLRDLLTLEATKWQYLTGVRDSAAISPDTWNHVQPLLDRAGNSAIQLALFYDYRNNVPLYPVWQAYFRQHQPPTLIVWGQHDPIFPVEGAHPYKCDLDEIEFHLLDTGHFSLEEDGGLIAELMLSFLDRTLEQTSTSGLEQTSTSGWMGGLSKQAVRTGALDWSPHPPSAPRCGTE